MLEIAQFGDLVSLVSTFSTKSQATSASSAENGLSKARDFCLLASAPNKFVIPTEAQRSGGICGAPFPLAILEDNRNPPLCHPACPGLPWEEPTCLRQVKRGMNERSELHFLTRPQTNLSSRTERSEVEGSAAFPGRLVSCPKRSVVGCCTPG